MTNEDINDIKSILNEQFDYIDRLQKSGCQSVLSQSLCDDIKGCNKVMMEIVCGPVGGIEKLVERTK
jgi:hypothetical protein